MARRGCYSWRHRGSAAGIKSSSRHHFAASLPGVLPNEAFGFFMTTAHAILFVHLGPQLPPWLQGAVYQARIFNRCPIIVVAEAAALAQAVIPTALSVTKLALEDLAISDRHRAFRAMSPFDREFCGGFWTFTTERLFVVEAAIAQLALSNVIHLENDVLLYCDLSTLVPALIAQYQGIGATFDNDARCVPGLMFLPGETAIARLNSFILAVLDALHQSREPAARKALSTLNDMALLGLYRGQGTDAIDHLPIVPPDYPAVLKSAAGHNPADPTRYSRHFDRLATVFDAAALGQYLGGIDPRNDPRPSRGFINESCVFDPRIVKARMSVDADGRKISVIETASGVHAVANLHIHSKNPTPFLSL
jgi:hypothetical protein